MRKKWTHFQQKLRFFLYRATLMNRDDKELVCLLVLLIRFDKGRETSALESPYSGRFTLPS